MRNQILLNVILFFLMLVQIQQVLSISRRKVHLESMRRFRMKKQHQLDMSFNKINYQVKKKNIDNNNKQQYSLNDNNSEEHKLLLKIFLNDEEKKQQKDSQEIKQCIVELKETEKKENQEQDSAAEKKEDEVEICECNVKCIQNCQNIQIGTDDQPVQHLDKNKYMIETYEDATITCFQSCFNNISKLNCEVQIQAPAPTK